MTTFQDPPPHSRRAVRQSERDETAAVTPDQGVPYAFDAGANTPISAPQAPAPQVLTAQAPVTPVSGRRAQLPTGPAFDVQHASAGFEPLTYSTQGRLAPPVDEQNHQQPLAAAPPPGATDPSGYRVRDFSPEGGRRVAPPRESTQSPLSAASSFPVPPSTPPVDLDYHTQGVPPAPSHSAAAQPLDDASNHTLTRRELREMRAAAEQQAPPLQMPESIDTLLNSGPIEIPTLAPPPGQSQALAEAMAEFDMLTRARRESEARARDAQVASLSTPITPTPITPTQQQPIAQQPPVPVVSVPVVSVPVVSVPVVSVPVTSVPIALEPIASVPIAPQPAASVPVASAPRPPVDAAPVAPVSVPEAPVAPPQLGPPATAPAPISSAVEPFEMQPLVPQASAPEPSVRPTPVFSDTTSVPESGQEQDEHGGRSPRASHHWRVQAAIEDDELPYENTLSRTVGSNTSAITTSALVLPSVPQPDSMLASLNSTGEILVTGSINLPRSLGSTGAHPDRVDHSDDEDDPFDSQVAAPDSAPVRAIRAVSTHTGTRGIIETKRPQGNRLLTGVIIAASVLCVGLVGLLVFAFATNRL